jgi:chromosome segregation ATPase
MVENAADVRALRADVDALRDRFPKTADLYRETCALMFFRYGMTPTTNALYQLVRKGSMTVPSEALRQFWNDLRRQSRVDVENAGLPEELRESAGKLLGQVWSSARQAAEESVAHLRDDFAAERDALLAAKARADEQTSVITTKLEDANRAVAARDEALVALREQLSAERVKGQTVESQLAEARAQVDRLQLEALATSRDHAADIDKVTARVAQAEQRYVELEKRTLVELDRERTAVGKLQKSLESERQVAAEKYEKLQSDAQTAQIRMARQEQSLATQRTEVATLREERDSAMVSAAEGRETAAALASQLAAEQARVQELRQQLRLYSEQAASERKSKRPRSTPSKRPDKPGTENQN